MIDRACRYRLDAASSLVILLIATGLSCVPTLLHAATVSGVCSNPTPAQDSTRVEFIPAGEADPLVTVLTDPSGEYAADVPDGAYDVRFDRPPLTPFLLTEQNLAGAVTLPDQALAYDGTLDPIQAGPLGPGAFFAPEGLVVEQGDTLILAPGTAICSGPHRITVHGHITAVGTATEPIVFTREPWSGGSWRGIRVEHDGVNPGRYGGEFHHVEIAHATEGGLRVVHGSDIGGSVQLADSWIHDCGVVGFSCFNYWGNFPNVQRVVIENIGGAGISAGSYNGTGDGSGIHVVDSAIRDCTGLGIGMANRVMDTAVLNCGGGGIEFRDGLVMGCEIRDCGGDGVKTEFVWYDNDNCAVHDCVIENNAGWGVFNDYEPLQITGSTVSENGEGGVLSFNLTMDSCAVVRNAGPGLYIADFGGYTAQHSVTRTLIAGNINDGQFAQNGGGVNAYGQTLVDHCVIAGNRLLPADYSTRGGGVYAHSNLTVTNSILAGNHAPEGDQLYIRYGESLALEYSLLDGRDQQDLIGQYFDDWEGLIPTQVNANGDSCDQYFNLVMDPLFVDPGSGDYRIQEPSPAVGAASGGGIIGTGDIVWTHHVEVDEPPGMVAARETDTPVAVTVSPNPFNDRAVIRLELDSPARLEIRVVDLLGRRVDAFGGERRFGPGRHAIVWDARNLASGTYFLRVRPHDYSPMTKRLLLLR